MIKYYINSTNGDYIAENTVTGQYNIYFLHNWQPLEITKKQFDMIKGFIPISQKRLFSNERRKKNLLLLELERTKVPTIQELREQKLTQLFK